MTELLNYNQGIGLDRLCHVDSQIDLRLEIRAGVRPAYFTRSRFRSQKASLPS
jgi:hypothetical protein